MTLYISFLCFSQFDNQLKVAVDVLAVHPDRTPEPVLVGVVKPNEMFSVPIDIVAKNFLVTPSEFG